MNASARNIIAKALGAFWLLDGLLQLQPQMFGPDFVTNVLMPNLSAQPGFIYTIVAWGIQLWNINPPVANTLAALLQMAIGILIFFPPASKTFRIGLWISIVWGMIVWLCGEGVGLLFTGTANFYTGAPGAVLIYVLLAVLLLLPQKIPTSWYPKIAGWIFILGAALQLQPSFWTAGETNTLLTLALFVVGLLLVLKPSKMIGIIALVFLFFVWWLGQAFGQLSTLWVGTATDPNTAPLLALFLVPLFVKTRSPSATALQE